MATSEPGRGSALGFETPVSQAGTTCTSDCGRLAGSTTPKLITPNGRSDCQPT